MAYFPFFMEVQGMRCLIVGGGMVAFRKVQVLLEYGASVRVVATEVCAEIRELAGQGALSLSECPYDRQCLEGAWMVVAATSDQELNRQISAECRALRIPVNVVDVEEECSFIFPALIKDGDIVVGISTGGASPAMARQLKQRIRETIPEGAGELAAWLKGIRPLVKERVDSQPARKAVFTELANRAMARGSRLSLNEVFEIIREVPRASAQGEQGRLDDGHE